jgi:hypothetical protein
MQNVEQTAKDKEYQKRIRQEYERMMEAESSSETTSGSSSGWSKTSSSSFPPGRKMAELPEIDIITRLQFSHNVQPRMECRHSC